MMRSILLIGLILPVFANGADVAGGAVTWGENFSPADGVALNIPARALRKLPDRLPLYTNSPTSLTTDGVVWIIENAVSDEGTRNVLRDKLAQNPSILRDHRRTVLHEDEHFRLGVDPGKGIVLFALQPGEADNLRRQAKQPAKTNFVALESFHAAMREFISKLGVAESEIERKSGGDYNVTGSDGQRYPNHQKEPELYLRTVTYNRKSPSGYPMASVTNPYGITLERFVNGTWKRICVSWPTLATSGFARVPRTKTELKAMLDSGKGLWDYNNEFDASDVKSISVTEIRVVYSIAPNGDSVPVICLDSKVTVAGKDEYAVIFIPLPAEQNAEPK